MFFEVRQKKKKHHSTLLTLYSHFIAVKLHCGGHFGLEFTPLKLIFALASTGKAGEKGGHGKRSDLTYPKEFGRQRPQNIFAFDFTHACA